MLFTFLFSGCISNIYLAELNYHWCIIIIEICKAPTLWLKALNKHNIIHIMYIKMENVIRKCNKKLTRNLDINKGYASM